MQDKQFPQARAQSAQHDQLSAMMGGQGQALVGAEAAKVLKNTYMLLSMTLLFSAFVAYMTLSVPFNMVLHFGALIGALVISFAMGKFANSSVGIVLTFAFTGLLGLTIGPIVGMVIGAGGASMVMNALGLTAFSFFGLSAFTLITRKDFSFMAGFLTVGFFVIIGAIILSLFIQSSAFSMAISAVIVLFAAAAILYETSAIVHGGQTNYILATVSLYSSIYNMFMNLLMLFMAMGGDE